MPNPFRELYEADQEDRRTLNAANAEAVYLRDSERLRHGLELLHKKASTGDQLTGEELVCLAMLHQHSPHVANIAMAHLLAWQAHQLGYEGDDVLPHPLRLAAFARDRWQTALGFPQHFGTQFRTSQSGQAEQLPLNEDTTDEERARWRVPTLAALQARAHIHQRRS